MQATPHTKYFEPERLARLGDLQLIARTVVEGYVSGLHKSPFKGHSNEFAAYRQYMPGDDLKHFDWKVYARTDKKYVREYEEETNMTCTLLLDCSASMGYGSSDLIKFDYGCCLCAALTYMMIHQHDRVGLAAFDTAIKERFPPRSNPSHMRFLLNRLEELHPSGETGMADALHPIASSLDKRGLIILISDLLDDQDAVINALQHFRHDRHEVVVFNLFDPAEIKFPFEGLSEFRDVETNSKMQVRPAVVRDAYREEFEQFVDEYRKNCRNAGIDYQLVDTSTPYELILSHYLTKRDKISRTSGT